MKTLAKTLFLLMIILSFKAPQSQAEELCPSTTTIPTQLEISSLLPTPEDGQKEWVEIHNKEAVSVNLDSYTLEDSTAHPQTLSGSLASGAKVKIDSLSFQLNNGGDTVTLKTSTGQILDVFSYSSSEVGTALTKGNNLNPEAQETSEEDLELPSNTPELLPEFSEALPNPEGSDTSEEWIELFNPHDQRISLSGLFLDDSEGGSKAHALSGYMSPREYKVFDVEDTHLSLNNSTDSIRLLGVDQEELWSVDYNNPKESESYIHLDGEYDWTDQLTPGEANRPMASEESAQNNGDLSEDLEITEILPNPEGADSEEEWIEITNGGDEEVDLGNWTLGDASTTDDPYIFPSGTIIKPGETLVIDRGTSKISLNNSNEKVILGDFTGDIIDEITFEKSIEGKSYAKVVVESVQSTQASTSGLGNPSNSTWQWLDPSPGVNNPVLKELIGTVEHFEGSILDLNDGVSTWRISTGGNSTQNLAFQEGNQLKVTLLPTEDGNHELLNFELLEAKSASAIKTQKKTPWTLIFCGIFGLIYLGIQEYKKMPKKHLNPILEFKS